MGRRARTSQDNLLAAEDAAATVTWTAAAITGQDDGGWMRDPRHALTAAADGSERFLLVLVLAAAAAGIAAPAAGRAVSAGDGINAALAVLVFATGLTLKVADLAAVRAAWRRIVVVLVASTAILPALAWATSRLIDDPVLRSGMLAVGVAPAEVATVALCVIAGGEAAVCAAILVASTIVTVLGAGPILSVLGASVVVSAGSLLGTLLVVIALPLAAGIGLLAVWEPGTRAKAVIRIVTVGVLLLLLWQVASQIRLNSAYTGVIIALVAYIAGSAALGRTLAVRLPTSRATAVILPVAMRDFAVAAGIAAAAFGPAAAAPLGAYGVLVLLAGSALTLLTRRRLGTPPR
jgi:BASS family bile acid:Na+ symporter